LVEIYTELANKRITLFENAITPIPSDVVVPSDATKCS